MVDVFEQVEDELRSERYKRLAKTWLPVVGAVLGVALIAALGWWAWQSHLTRQADAASADYQRGLETLQGGNPTGADAAFVEAARRGGAYRTLALQQRASIALTRNQIPQAIELLDQAAQSSRDPLMSDAPALKAAWLAMDTDASLADLEARLEPLADDKRPLHHYAREALAMARMQHGQLPAAREAFVLLQRELGVPQDVSDRAQIAVEAIDSGAAAQLPALIAAAAAIPQAPAAEAAEGSPVQAPAQ